MLKSLFSSPVFDSLGFWDQFVSFIVGINNPFVVSLSTKWFLVSVQSKLVKSSLTFAFGALSSSDSSNSWHFRLLPEPFSPLAIFLAHSES